jgi:hypothetical protein
VTRPSWLRAEDADGVVTRVGRCQQWGYIEPLLSDPKPHGIRPGYDKHELVNDIGYVVRTGWRLAPQRPTDFPPWETVYWWWS